MTKAKSEIGNVILGQDKVVELSIGAMLSGGHALLVGVPGLAKTLLVETLGTVLGLDEKRIQFTPDLSRRNNQRQTLFPLHPWPCFLSAPNGR